MKTKQILDISCGQFKKRPECAMTGCGKLDFLTYSALLSVSVRARTSTKAFYNSRPGCLQSVVH